MPPTSAPPSVRRRGAFSAEPVTEEDATSYVKKVRPSSARCQICMQILSKLIFRLCPKTTKQWQHSQKR